MRCTGTDPSTECVRKLLNIDLKAKVPSLGQSLTKKGWKKRKYFFSNDEELIVGDNHYHILFYKASLLWL